MLAWYGGSPYYLLTGIAVVVSGILIWRRDGRGVPVYVAVLASTTTWAIWEVGFDGWQLLPWLLAPFVLGLALLPPSVRLGGRQSPATRWGDGRPLRARWSWRWPRARPCTRPAPTHRPSPSCAAASRTAPPASCRNRWPGSQARTGRRSATTKAGPASARSPT